MAIFLDDNMKPQLVMVNASRYLVKLRYYLEYGLESDDIGTLDYNLIVNKWGFWPYPHIGLSQGFVDRIFELSHNLLLPKKL